MSSRISMSHSQLGESAGSRTYRADVGKGYQKDEEKSVQLQFTAQKERLDTEEQDECKETPIKEFIYTDKIDFPLSEEKQENKQLSNIKTVEQEVWDSMSGRYSLLFQES
jgi:catalase (peroxidase I)